MKETLKKFIRFISPGLLHWIQLHSFMFRMLPPDFVSHLRRLNKSHLVLDVGANVGLVSECIARKGAKVIAFEPNPYARSALEKVATRFNNIEVRPTAAGIKNQKVKLYLHDDFDPGGEDVSQASSLLIDKPNVSKDMFEEVYEIDFAEYLRTVNRPIELIKIDIEGYEVTLINHLLDQKVLDQVNKIYLETHEKKFPELVSPTEALKKRIVSEGYESKFFFDWH